MKITFFLFALLLAPSSGQLSAQDRFDLKNPSFETDPPQIGRVPEGWIDLGAENTSPVDILPGFWGVNLPAQDGQNYVGMVVRDNQTWEGIGQALKGFLRKDSTYSFSLWLAKSRIFTSPSPNSNGELLNFTAPTILKIWGFNTATQAQELLAESQAIGVARWTKYSFVFQPQNGDYNEIDLMAYYATGQEGKNGNLLMDNCSAIEKKQK